jgi:integrase/recombinase XerD
VNFKDKIYNYENRINRTLDRIHNSKIDEKSKKQLEDFYRECIIQGLSKARIAKYLDTLGRIAKWLNKPFAEVQKEDLMSLVQKIESGDYSDWTKHDYKLILKIFYKWLKKTEDYPEIVKWISTRVRNNNHVLPEEVLTEEDIQKLAEYTSNLRDKAFVLVLYESGCRIGELLSLKIRNVQFDDYGAVLIVSGKTGDRRVRIIFSVPKLASWIENHPQRESPDAPLWVCLGTRNRGTVLSYASAKSMLKDIAQKGGLKKRIYPHLFRHSRATYLANHLTEAQLKHHFGWVQSSKMAATYVHLSGREIDSALLMLQGIKVDEDKDETQLKVISCPRCKNENSPTSKFCNVCGYCLDTKTAVEMDQLREKADGLMNELVKNPKILDSLLEGIEDLKLRRL